MIDMEQQVHPESKDSYRSAGLAAITSGVIGLAAFGLLMDAVLTRVTWIPADRISMLFNAHDIGVALQFSFVILAAFGLRTLSRQNPPGFSRTTFATGLGTVILIVLLVLLGVGNKLVSNGLYTFPQGMFGIWLIAVNWRLAGSLPGWLRWFGMIVGLGLVLVGVSFVGLCFVYPMMLYIPAVPVENVREVNSAANTFFHQLIFYASFVGVATLPIWTVLIGFQLLKRARHAAIEQTTLQADAIR